MADYDLGTARGKIEIESNAEYGIGRAGKAVDDMKSKMDKASGTLLRTGAALTTVGALGVAAFGMAVNAAAKFEQNVSGIAAVSGATEQQLDQVRKKALQLGADTKFSAAEAAEGIEELVKAGLSVEEALNGGADAAVNLAAAGGIELRQAAIIAANAMNQFGLSAEELPRVADVLAGAANASAADVEQLGMALSQVGAVARTVGLSFDDTVLALSALADAGIKGSDAGTSLKTFLVNLIPSTKEARDLMIELGLAQYEGGVSAEEYEKALQGLEQAQEAVSNAQKDLNDLLDDFKAQDADADARAQAEKLDDVARATERVSDAQRALQELRDRQAAGAAESSEDFRERQLQAVERATDGVAQAQKALEDLRARQAASGEADSELERLTRQNQMEDALARVAKAQDELNKAQSLQPDDNTGQRVSQSQQLDEAVRNVAEAQAKLNEARNQPDKALQTETERVNRAQALRDAQAKLVETQGKLNDTNRILEGGVGQLSNKFFDQNGKLKSLAEVSQILQDALKGQTEEQKLATLQTLFGTDAIRAASVISREGADGIKTLYGEMKKSDAASVAGDRMDNLKGDTEQLKGSMETLMISLGTLLIPVLRDLVQWLTSVTNWFANLSPNVQKAILIALGIATALVTAAGAFALIGGGILKVITVFKELRMAFAVLKEIQLLQKAVALLNATFLANPIVLLVAALVALGVGIYMLYKKWQPFHDFVDNFWQMFQAGWDRVLGFLGNMIDWFSKLPGNIRDAIVGALSAIWDAGVRLVTSLAEGIWSVQKQIFDFWIGLPGAIIEWVGNGLSLLWNYGGDLIRGLWEGIMAVKDWITRKVKSFFSDILGPIADALGIGSPSKKTEQFGRWLMQGLVNGVIRDAADLRRAWQQATENAITPVSTQLGLSSARSAGVVGNPAYASGPPLPAGTARGGDGAFSGGDTFPMTILNGPTPDEISEDLLWKKHVRSK